MQFKARKAPKYTKNSNNIEKFQTLISHSAISQNITYYKSIPRYSEHYYQPVMKRTNPPSAQVAAMRTMQQQKLQINVFENS